MIGSWNFIQTYVRLIPTCVQNFGQRYCIMAELWRHKGLFEPWNNGNNRNFEIVISPYQIKFYSWNLLNILIIAQSFQHNEKNWHPSCLLFVIGTPLFYCLQTIENKRKTMETIGIHVFSPGIKRCYCF